MLTPTFLITQVSVISNYVYHPKKLPIRANAFKYEAETGQVFNMLLNDSYVRTMTEHCNSAMWSMYLRNYIG